MEAGKRQSRLANVLEPLTSQLSTLGVITRKPSQDDIIKGSKLHTDSMKTDLAKTGSVKQLKDPYNRKEGIFINDAEIT